MATIAIELSIELLSLKNVLNSFYGKSITFDAVGETIPTEKLMKMVLKFSRSLSR